MINVFTSMQLKYFFRLLLVFFVFNTNAQEAQDDILFTVDNTPVYVSEFLRVYNKNLDLVQDETQKDVKEYLKLLTNYKLKLKEAKTLKLHKKSKYLRELATYKKQLANDYMRDSKVSEAFVLEAYQRMLYEVKASHILIKIPEGANAEDTLVAYNNIIKLRNKALTEGFEAVREEVHNGKTIFGEKLGYFSGFKMVYKFENQAYNTTVNSVSMPFRTRFGYHIVYVEDKRESRGERTVAHIMLVEKKDDTLVAKPEIRIKDIYKKIQQGESFETLAKQFSNDKGSASKGGLLKPFSGGQLSSQEFEEVAFNLNNKNDISKPFKTNHGWHIVKLIDKKPVPQFEAIKSELEVKVKRDSRSKLIDNALYSKLKKRYKISDAQPALDYFVSILNDNYFKRTWKLPQDFKANNPLLKIGKKQFSFKDFGDYLLTSQRKGTAKALFKVVISKKYNDFLNKSLVRYHEDNLEYENEEFAHVLNEYRDGLLLFDLMESTIWNSAKTDSVAVKAYYNSNKNKYVLPKRVDAIVASSSKQSVLKKVAKLLESGMALSQIKALVNSKDKIEVIFSSGIMDANHQALPKPFLFKKGMSKIYPYNDNFVIVLVKTVLPPTQKIFEDAKGLVISDYQNHKESNWIKSLNSKYKVIVNQDVLNKVIQKIKNQ